MNQYTYTGPTGERPYFVYVPQSYRVGKAVPLLVMLHGCTQKAVDFAAGTHMNELAERHNFIAVYPQQMRSANKYSCWNWFLPDNQARDSGEPAIIAGIVREMIQQTTQWTIDVHRIYVTGISAGAAMAVTLGATYPDLFAAIGVHSGVAYRAAVTMAGGLRTMRRGGPDPVQQGVMAYTAMQDRARMVPTIVFHGTGDFTVSSTNGDQVIRQWMQTNMLASRETYMANFQHPTTTTTGELPASRSYVVQAWKNTHGQEIQEYWKINGMGHAWSGGSGTSFMDPKGPDASEAMYRFFMKHAQEYPRRKKEKHSLATTEALPAPFWKNILHNVVDFLYEKKE